VSAAVQFCTFVLDGQLFGIEVSAVREVVRDQPITPVPLAPAAVRGLVNLRGRIVTAVDLRLCLGRPAGHPPGHPPPAGPGPGPGAATLRRARNLVVLGEAHGDVSFIVDEVREVRAAGPETFEPAPPTLGEAARGLIRGTHKLAERLLLILDVPRTLEAAGA